MSYRFDAPLHAAGYHFGFRGLGVLGSTIPSAGANGPGYGYPSVDPADLNEELWFPITGTPPAGGFFNEDTSFTYAGASTSFGFRKVRAGVDQGSATATIVTGVTLVSADLALSYAIDPVTLVSADLAISYAIDPLALVSADLTLSYQVLNNSGSLIDASAVPKSRVVVFGGGSRVVNFDTPFTGPYKEDSMTNAPVPYFKNGRWWVDKDPDEESFYVANITKELTDRGTAAVSIESIVEGVEVLIPEQIQGEFVVIKLGGLDLAENAENYWTARVRCANGERFDRTMWFNRVDN